MRSAVLRPTHASSSVGGADVTAIAGKLGPNSDKFGLPRRNVRTFTILQKICGARTFTVLRRKPPTFTLPPPYRINGGRIFTDFMSPVSHPFLG